jgi:hypothetical protein
MKFFSLIREGTDRSDISLEAAPMVAHQAFTSGCWLRGRRCGADGRARR